MFKTRVKGGRNVVDISLTRKYRERFNCLGYFVAIMSRLHVVKPLSCESALTLAENFPFLVRFHLLLNLSQAEQLATCINMPRLAGKNGNCDYNNRSALSINCVNRQKRKAKGNECGLHFNIVIGQDRSTKIKETCDCNASIEKIG